MRNSIAKYLDHPRFGQCRTGSERVSGVGPCVQIFGNWITCREEDFDRIMAQEPGGIKIFDDDDNIKFLLNLSNHYLALSGRSLCVFHARGDHVTEELCEDDDEIIGHGKIEELTLKRDKIAHYSEKHTLKFKVLVVFKSGVVRRLPIVVTSQYKDIQMKIGKGTTNTSAVGTLIAAPIMDKTSLVLIYDNTIVKEDGIVCRGTPAEGRQVVFAAGTPWKNKIFLITDDGEAHYAKMTGKVGDGKLPLFGSGKTTVSSSGLHIKEPTACTLWMNREMVVGNENGELFRLEKKDLNLFDEYELEFGPLTFLQGHGEELWIGSKEGEMQNFDDIC